MVVFSCQRLRRYCCLGVRVGSGGPLLDSSLRGAALYLFSMLLRDDIVEMGVDVEVNCGAVACEVKVVCTHDGVQSTL